MSEETQTVSESPAVASSTRHEVKEAEVKLKEMSRKAKERKSTQTTRKPPQRQSGSNLRLALIGGFGVGVLGILYLMFRSVSNEARGSKEDWVFTPKEKDGEKPVKQRKLEVRESPKKDEPRKMIKPEFEMNSF